MEGPDALAAVVGQLEGFEAPAGAWETEILPARLAGYEPAWLDDHCLAGRVAWARLRPRNPKANGSERSVAPVRTTPITLLARRHLAALGRAVAGAGRRAAERQGAGGPRLHPRSTAPRSSTSWSTAPACCARRSRRRSAELVALGLVNSDSFAGLRALLVPADKRRSSGRRRAHRLRHGGCRPLGARAPAAAVARPGRTATARRSSISRARCCAATASCSGACSSARPPGCRRGATCLRVYRRLEARGEIRGGRFVAGFSGEQFALPDAIGLLREVRRKPATGALVSLSGADPLNLAGILTPGPKLAALTGNRLLYRDGLPIALLAGGEVKFLETLDPAAEWQARKALLRSAARGSLVDLG